MTEPLAIAAAIDAYLGDLARRGRRPTTRRTYRRLLNDFADSTPKRYVHELALSDFERFLDRWQDAQPSTLASGVSLCTGFSSYLYERDYLATDICHPLKRPKRLRYEDLNVVTVSGEDVARMLDACEDWQEFICLTTAAYLGARRAALAGIRRRDVDLVRGTARFLEKGGKVVTKPLPGEYQEILATAERHGLWNSGEDWLIPNRRPASVKGKERSDKIVWETVKRVAGRVSVRAHVHAFRAAFAVAFDASHPQEVLTLKDLMGHSRLESTLIYLRRRDKAAGMEAVRDLSWGRSPGFGLSPEALKAHTGFEPVPPPDRLVFDIRRKLDALATSRVVAYSRETE